MSMFTWELALACGLLVPGQSAPVPAQAATVAVQTPPAQAAANFGDLFAYYEVDWAEAASIVLAQAGATSPRPAVDEEIEVMRALLLRKLGGAVDRSTSGQNANRLWTTYLNNQQPNTLVQGQNRNYYPPTGYTVVHGPVSVEGTYLDGYGATLTVMLPAQARHDPNPRMATPTPAPLSDWERTRRQIQGETVAPQTATAPKESPLGDVLLHLLADNGKHFTHLRDDERLTVVVVFRGGAGGSIRWSTSTNSATALGTANTLTGTTGSTTATGTSGSTTSSSATQTARDLELLADLHVKQGQYDQGLAEIEKALKQMEDNYRQLESTAGSSHPKVLEYAKAMNTLYAKQASALLAVGKVNAARDVLQKIQAIDHVVASRQTTTTTTSTAKAPGPSLPAKLTVSATKKQLDLVGAGKMTFEDFRKEAKVTFYPATGADKPVTTGEKK